MSYKADLEIQDTINGTMGVGVDYYKGDRGNDGYTPVKGKDYFTQEEIEKIEQDAIDKISTDGFVKSADLANVAKSGSYKDLIDKPEPIDLTPYPTKDEVEQGYAKKTDLPEPYELPVASDTVLGGVKVGSGLSITNGVLSANGGGVADSVDWSKVQNKPDFATVATSGDYNDLSNKPSIPSVDGLVSKDYVDSKIGDIVIPSKTSELENDSGYLTEHQDLSLYAKTADLAQVAKTGSYNDLTDTPTIPSTTGLASKEYVDQKVESIEIPTKVSAFENDKGYLTEHQDLSAYAKKTEIPTIPTNVSAFTNDAGYLTEHQSLAGYALKSEIPDTTNLATKDEVQEIENKILTVKVDSNNHVYQINNKEISALYDGVGNIINSTYASKAELTGVENKIPEPYTLPMATTSTLGGVKPDGTTITVADGVISAVGSGGGEPDAYIKDASVSGNTLTLTKKDDTEIVFTPSGSGGSSAPSYALKLKDTYTADDIAHIEAVKADRNIQMTIDNFPVIGFYDVDLGNGSVANYIVTDDNDFSMVRKYQYRQGLTIQVASFESKSVKRLQWSGVTKNSDLPGWIMDWVKNPYQYLVTVDDGGIVISVDKAMFQNPPYLSFDYISMINGEPTLTKCCSIYFTNMNMNAYNSKNPQKGTKDTILTASNYSNYIK